MDAGEDIRFRVTSENFVDTSPSGPSDKDATKSDSADKDSKIPYQIQASINEPGLGLLTWWNSWVLKLKIFKMPNESCCLLSSVKNYANNCVVSVVT